MPLFRIRMKLSHMHGMDFQTAVCALYYHCKTACFEDKNLQKNCSTRSTIVIIIVISW